MAYVWWRGCAKDGRKDGIGEGKKEEEKEEEEEEEVSLSLSRVGSVSSRSVLCCFLNTRMVRLNSSERTDQNTMSFDQSFLYTDNGMGNPYACPRNELS